MGCTAFLRRPTSGDVVSTNSQKGKRGAVEPRPMGDTHGRLSGDLSNHGITPSGDVYWNMDTTDLIAMAVERG